MGNALYREKELLANLIGGALGILMKSYVYIADISSFLATGS